MNPIRGAVPACVIAIGPGVQRGAAQDEVSATIQTRRVGGHCRPVGEAICILANENWHMHGIRCTIDTTGGSIPNTKDLQEGDVELHHAFYGNGTFLARDTSGTFVWCSDCISNTKRSSPVTDANVTRSRTERKRVYLGREDSSRHHAMDVQMGAHGWTSSEVTDITTFKPSNIAEAQCDDAFDAFVYAIGHPKPTGREAATLCDINLMDVSPEITGRRALQNKFCMISVMKCGTYRGNPPGTPTLCVPSMQASSVNAKENVIYEITKANFESLELLQDLSPLFLSLPRDEMVQSGLNILFHSGALKYFAEARLK